MLCAVPLKWSDTIMQQSKQSIWHSYVSDTLLFYFLRHKMRLVFRIPLSPFGKFSYPVHLKLLIKTEVKPNE